MHQARPYQTKAIEAILSAVARGVRRALVVMPTGTGKTQVFVWTIEEARAMGNRRPALIVAHREELLQQAAARVQALCPELRVGIERAESRVPADGADVVVASVQTIGSSRGGRLEWLKPGIIIIDEAHHVAASAVTYMAVVERYGAEAFVLGVTATPKRLDRLSLHTSRMGVFEEVVFDYTIRQAIDDGWLCPLRGYQVHTKIDLDGIRNVAGDFNQTQLAAAVVNEARTRRAIEHWQEVAEGRSTIAFGVNVAHAGQIAAAFEEAGVSAESVDGSMSRDERAEILDRFQRRKTTVLANCQIATEGFDAPHTSCIVMLRPTQSWSLYVQMVGRGTRLAPGKEDCIILDVVDLSSKHDLATVPAILDLPPRLNLEGRTLSEAAEALEVLGSAAGFLQDYAPSSFTELETVLKQIDLFRRVEPPAEVHRSARLAWLSVPGGYLVQCGGDDRREARLVRDAMGGYSLRLTVEACIPEGRFRQLVADEIHLSGDIERVLVEADHLVLNTWLDAQWIAGLRAKWRQAPATEKQRAALRRFGYPEDMLRTITKGEASGLITQRFAGGRR